MCFVLTLLHFFFFLFCFFFFSRLTCIAVKVEQVSTGSQLPIILSLVCGNVAIAGLYYGVLVF